MLLRDVSSGDRRRVRAVVAQTLDHHGVLSSLDDVHTEGFRARLIAVGSLDIRIHYVGPDKIIQTHGFELVRM